MNNSNSSEATWKHLELEETCPRHTRQGRWEGSKENCCVAGFAADRGGSLRAMHSSKDGWLQSWAGSSREIRLWVLLGTRTGCGWKTALGTIQKNRGCASKGVLQRWVPVRCASLSGYTEEKVTEQQFLCADVDHLRSTCGHWMCTSTLITAKCENNNENYVKST